MFLKDNGLRSFVTIDVARRTYTNETLNLSVNDDLKYGTFLSFEDKDSTRPLDVFEQEIATLLNQKQVLPLDINYVDQLLQSTEVK